MVPSRDGAPPPAMRAATLPGRVKRVSYPLALATPCSTSTSAH